MAGASVGWVFEDEGDGAVVGELDGHVACEDAGGDVVVCEFGVAGGGVGVVVLRVVGVGGEEAAEFFEEGVVAALGLGGGHGGGEARASAFGGVGGECEVGDGEGAAVDVGEGAVHLVVVIGEDAEAGDAVGGPAFDVGLVVGFEADEDGEAWGGEARGAFGAVVGA